MFEDFHEAPLANKSTDTAHSWHLKFHHGLRGKPNTIILIKNHINIRLLMIFHYIHRCTHIHYIYPYLTHPLSASCSNENQPRIPQLDNVHRARDLNGMSPPNSSPPGIRELCWRWGRKIVRASKGWMSTMTTRKLPFPDTTGPMHI